MEVHLCKKKHKTNLQTDSSGKDKKL